MYLQVTNPELTDRILRQGRALVRAIETLGTIKPSAASSARTLWHYESKRIDLMSRQSLDFRAKLYYTMCARQKSNALHLRAGGGLAEQQEHRGGKD